MQMIWHCCLTLYDHVQEKTRCLSGMAATVVLRINQDKTKLMKMKTVSRRRVMLTKGQVRKWKSSRTWEVL